MKGRFVLASTSPLGVSTWDADKTDKGNKLAELRRRHRSALLGHRSRTPQPSDAREAFSSNPARAAQPVIDVPAQPHHERHHRRVAPRLLEFGHVP